MYSNVLYKNIFLTKLVKVVHRPKIKQFFNSVRVNNNLYPFQLTESRGNLIVVQINRFSGNSPIHVDNN